MTNNTVYVYVDLYQILDVDEKNGVLSAKLWVYMYYFTPSAHWNRSEFGGLDFVVVPAKTFWQPDLGKFC